MILDTLYQLLGGVVIGLCVFMLPRSFHFRPPSWFAAVLVLLAFLVYWFYFAIFEILWNGQTPGKRHVGIRVIKDSGRSLTSVETLGRNLMRAVDQLPGFYGVAVISASISSQGKRLGDFVAGSIVVHERSLKEVQAVWRRPAVSAFSSPIGGNRLSPEDIALIETFLARRADLPYDVRQRMGHDILHRLSPKLMLTEDDRAGVESTLERLVHEHRA